jgi:hypothetical protein
MSDGLIFNCFAGYSIRVHPLNVVTSFLISVCNSVIYIEYL